MNQVSDDLDARRPFDGWSLDAASALECRAYGDFAEWLAASGGTLVVSTYNSGKLALFAAPHGQIIQRVWKVPRPMGLAVDGDRLAVAMKRHISVLRPDANSNDFQVEAVYRTGRLDVHDLAFDRRGLLMANTRFNCVSRPSERVRFLRTWQPPFIPAVVSRDCCHLNGLGVQRGRLAIVTAFGESCEPSRWRAVDRFSGGILVDVPRNRVVARGLCMPHSPRWHGGRWWFCNSGAGALAAFDLASGAWGTVASLPGFTRGLCFAAGRAVVGLSRIRPRHILDAPPVRERFAKLRAGVSAVDVTSGAETGWLEFVRGGREVYEVAFLRSATLAASDDGDAKRGRVKPFWNYLCP